MKKMVLLLGLILFCANAQAYTIQEDVNDMGVLLTLVTHDFGDQNVTYTFVNYDFFCKTKWKPELGAWLDTRDYPIDYNAFADINSVKSTGCTKVHYLKYIYYTMKQNISQGVPYVSMDTNADDYGQNELNADFFEWLEKAINKIRTAIQNILDEIQSMAEDIARLKQEGATIKKEMCDRDKTYSWC